MLWLGHSVSQSASIFCHPQSFHFRWLNIPRMGWAMPISILLYFQPSKMEPSCELKIIPCFCVLSASRGTQYFDSTSNFWSTLFIACWRVTRCSWFMFFDDKILRETEQALKINSKRFLIKIPYIKVVRVFSMVISSEFRMDQYRDDDHRKDAPHFKLFLLYYFY